MSHKWKDVRVSLTVGDLEVVDREELPLLLGKDKKLDLLIGQTCKDGTPLWKGRIVVLKNYMRSYEEVLLSKGVCDALNQHAGSSRSAEASLEALSTGYDDPGSMSGPPDNWYPPEGEDERTVTEVTLTFYDDEGMKIKDVVLNDKEYSGSIAAFETQFYNELCEVELQ